MYGYSSYSYLLTYGKAVAAPSQAVIELLAFPILFFLVKLAAWPGGRRCCWFRFYVKLPETSLQLLKCPPHSEL